MHALSYVCAMLALGALLESWSSRVAKKHGGIYVRLQHLPGVALSLCAVGMLIGAGILVQSYAQLDEVSADSRHATVAADVSTAMWVQLAFVGPGLLLLIVSVVLSLFGTIRKPGGSTNR